MVFRNFLKTAMMAALLAVMCGSVQAGNIDAVNKYAWGENAGWVNFNPTDGSVAVYADHLEGYAWNECIGWIRLGAYTGGGSHSYDNSSDTNYGVNNDGSGNLSGYAWSENFGWINFKPTGGGVSIDATGNFSGYAWGEGIGWIHFANTTPAYKVVTIIKPIFGIRGRVHDGEKGLAGVKMNIFSAKVNSAANPITDADGYYEASELKISDDYLASAHSAAMNTDFFYSIPEGAVPGVYIPTESVLMPDKATRITLSEQQPFISNIDIIVTTGDSGASISGNVVFPEDAEVGDTIHIAVSSQSKGISTGTDVQFTGSDTVRYQIPGLAPASDYIVYISSSSKYLNFYYNGQDRGTPNQETALRLDTTKTANITVNLKLSVGRSISGWVYDESGKGKSGIPVEVWSKTTGTAGYAASGTDGGYEIRGLYSSPDFIVQIRDPVRGIFFYRDKNLSVISRISAASVNTMQGNASDINISILPFESIRGKVSNPAGQPLEKMWVEAWSELQQSGSGIFTDSIGNYQISGLPRSIDYKVTARPDWFSQPVERDNISSNTAGLNFTPDIRQGYAIRGMVRNSGGEPVSRVRIELWSESLNIHGEIWAVSDSAGAYEIKGIDYAADYTMRVWPRDDSPYAFSVVENIVLSDNAKVLELAAGMKISGKVTDTDGKPMPNIQVIVIEPAGYFRKETKTDADGHYVISNVPTTSETGGTPKYNITVLIRDGISQTRENKSAGEVTDFVLGNAGKITGQVKDYESGKGLSGVTVEAYSVSISGVKNFGGTGTTDDSGKYVINGLNIRDLQGVLLNDYQVTVNAAGYPPQSKDAKKVGEEVNFDISRSSQNEISGTVKDADGKIISSVAEAYEQNGKFVSSAIADSAGNFKIGTLISGKQYYLKFTAFLNDTDKTASQWSVEGETGINNSAKDNVPEGAKLYSTNTTVHFRFGVIGTGSSEDSKPGTVVNPHSISHVGTKPVNPKLRNNIGVENIPVSNNPNITTTWEPPAADSELKYYVVYNTDADYTINKRNAPESSPTMPTQATSQNFQGDDITVYCHIAVIDDRGRIGETVTIAFRIDTVPPNGTVSAPPEISEDTVSLTLGVSGPGVREMYISNTGYGQNGEWETRVKDKNWKLSDGDGVKDIYVQYRDEAGNVANYHTTTRKIGEKPIPSVPTPDITPFVIQNQIFTVNINAPDGTVIGRIVVQNMSGNISFTVLSGNTGDVFIIDPKTGEIMIGNKKLLIQNGAKNYQLAVKVSDGNTDSSAIITMKVADVGKENLVVSDHSFIIDINYENDTYVGTVKALAADSSAQLSYHIVSGNDEDIFAINTKTGDIIVYDSSRLSVKTYAFVVEVSDGTNKARGTVTIKVIDSESEISFSDQNFSVNEDAPIGTVIATVKAESSAAAVLTYRIISGGSGLFAIDEKTGEIRLIGQLNYDKAASYTLEIEVSDGKSVSTANILISVNATGQKTLQGTWSWENPNIAGAASAWFKNITGIDRSGMIVVGGRFDYDASVYKNLIYRYSDGQWSEMQSNSSEWLYDVWGRSSSDIFAVGWAGVILHYDGIQWTQMKSPTTGNLYAVSGDNSVVIAAGEKGTLLVYDGSAWKSVETDGSALLNGVWGADGIFLIAGESGIILRYDGRNITPENTGISENLNDIRGRSLSDIYAVGDHGTILHYDGRTWTTQRSGGTEKFNSIAVSDKHVFVAGDSGVVFHSSGRGWEQVPTGTEANFRGIRTDDTSASVVGDNGAILRFSIMAGE